MKELTRKELEKEWELHRAKVRKRTALNAGETRPEQLARIQKMKTCYRTFFEYQFPHYAKVPCADFHIEWANAILQNEKIDAHIAAYRSGAKSVHITIGIPLWLMIQDELNFMILVGENSVKADKLLVGIQAELEYNQRFIHDFGIQSDGSTTWQNGNFKTKKGKSFFSLGLGQDPRGLREGAERPDYIVVDDADTLQKCKNKALMDELFSWVNGSLKGCFDATDDSRERFVLANNIIHKNALMAMSIKRAEQILANATNENNATNEAAANNTDNSNNGTPSGSGVYVSIVNALDDLGNPTWLAKTSKKYWEKKKAKTPMREWEREYMNNPIENGTIFKAEHLIFGTPPPIAEMDAIVGYGDLSYRATGDYKAFMILGRKGNKFYLLDVFCRRSDLATVANWMYDCDEKYRAQGFLYAEYWVEGSFIQDDFIEEFDKVGGQRSCYVPVCPDKSQKGDKHIRIEAMSRFFVAGAIIFDKRLDNESDFETFKDQLFAFEKGSGANDDAPDALQGALTKLNNKFKITAFEPELGTHTRTSGW